MTFGFTISIDPIESRSSARRFLELHFLWPIKEKLFIEEIPSDFGLRLGSIVTKSTFRAKLKMYCRKNNTDEATLKEEGKLKLIKFSITQELGKAIHEATRTFKAEKTRKISPLGAGFFVLLFIAYIALLLNIKTNLAESVSPLIWGNLPLQNRRSEIMKILWRIPSFEVIKSRAQLFIALPTLVVLTIILLSAAQKYIIDALMMPYSTVSIAFTAIFSLIVTTIMFTALYKLHVSGISRRNAAFGAFVAAALWLGGRWFFTTYGAVSLYRNLRNFAFVPIFLTWFYYFCTVFLFGLYVSHTLENPNLSYTARAWAMRDISCVDRYARLSTWVRLDFLYRLAMNRYQEYPPPFIEINARSDTADEIASDSYLPPTFVRECILIMISNHKEVFHIGIEGNRQYCTLKCPPEEVDIIPLLMDPQNSQRLINEMEEYNFGHFILNNFGLYWSDKKVMLSDVYNLYQEQKRKKLCNSFDFGRIICLQILLLNIWPQKRNINKRKRKMKNYKHSMKCFVLYQNIKEQKNFSLI